MYSGLYIFIAINIALALAFFSLQTTIGFVIAALLVAECALYVVWRLRRTAKEMQSRSGDVT